MKTIALENNPQTIKMFDQAGVDRIMIDLETLGKKERQGHLDTIISSHTIQDVREAKKQIKKSQLLVRINPINQQSQKEINEVIEAGAQIIMLPMFKTSAEVATFIAHVSGRAQTCLLLETAQALCRIDEILAIKGIDEIHIGLNDLHLSLGLDFLFEPMTNGIVEYLANKIKAKNIPFGIGGVARIGKAKFCGRPIIREHVRLGSTRVILSRSFKQEELLKNQNLLSEEIQKIHDEVKYAEKQPPTFFTENSLLLKTLVDEVVKSKSK